MASMRVLIADDHPLVREGLQGVLELEPDIEVVGEAVDGEQAVALAESLKPDLILIDLLMPKKDGLQAIVEIMAANPQARLLVLTSVTDLEQVLPAIQAGAMGYVAKNAQPAELLQAIRSVHQGGVHLPANLTRMLIHGTDYLKKQIASSPTLTDREVEILRLVALGFGNEQIANKLVISPRTAGVHISHILEKLELQNRTQAALYALRRGLVSLYPDGETRANRGG